MPRIVECVPNFSEGRRLDVVDQIRSAIASIEGVTFLDQHSDADHNRTVLTFVGEPDAVEHVERGRRARQLGGRRPPPHAPPRGIQAFLRRLPQGRPSDGDPRLHRLRPLDVLPGLRR